MGWATYLTTDIVFNRQTFKTIHEVNDAIEENKKMIDYYKTKLNNLAMMTEPKKMMTKDCDEPLWWVQKEFDEYYEGLEECIIEDWKLGLLYDEWFNCHDKDGKPIRRELSINYIEGDDKRCYYGSEEQCKEKFKKRLQKHNLKIIRFLFFLS